jgi:predicted TIM-barrel fold metal-dependent hydrolase
MMDRLGIEKAVTSISSPGVYFGDKEFARGLARTCNEVSARIAKDHPRRFGGFACLPLPGVDSALRELEYALDVLSLDGAALLTNYGGEYLGSPCFEELFAELNRRKALVFVHPTDPPFPAPLGNGIPNFLMEVTFDTTRAVTNLVYSGTLERHPDVSMIFAHAGGVVPYIAWRLSLGSFVIKDALQKAPKGFLPYLRTIYYDTGLSASPFALKSLLELVDSSRVMLGTDFPFAPEPIAQETIKNINQYNGFTSGDIAAIEWGNAVKALNRVPA